MSALNEPSAPNRPQHLPDLLIVYCLVASAIAGAVCGVMFIGIVNLADRWESSAYTKLILHEEFAGWRYPPPRVSEFIEGAMIGLISGALVSLAIWWVMFAWPAVMQPIRATALCASLAGTLGLLISGGDSGLDNPEGLIIHVASMLVLGATYGSLTAILVNRALRIHTRWLE
jgi:hypothetical protein